VPTYLHQIDQRLWLETSPAWLPAGEATADEVTNLKTSNNELSVYAVSRDDTTAFRVATALAASRQKLQDFDYILFEDAVLIGLDIRVKSSSGTTPDAEVNTWHSDLIQLSGTTLARLAAELRKLPKGRFLKERLQDDLLIAVKPGGRFAGGKAPNIEKYFAGRGLL
jgi:hypothetical protein